MPEIVIAEFMDEAAVAELAADFDVLYHATLVDQIDALTDAASGCRALIVRNRTQVRGPFLEACRQLEVVGRLGVGLDNIDLAACEDRGIVVLPAIGANNLAVAEYVIAGVLMLLRGAYQSSAPVASGEWPRNALIGREMAGARLGLVGFGGIARETASRAVALGMSVVAHDPHLPDDHPAWSELSVEKVAFDLVLATCDAVSLHVPLDATTRHLIDAAALARMGKDAVLINAARGGVVDEPALAAALREGRLGGAMLDVFESEPLPGDSLLVEVPNLILTPHIAGVSVESNVRVSTLIASKVRDHLRATG
ncbi:MAG: hydroxyacid dehydrogenase [Pseudomonadota bacterium]